MYRSVLSSWVKHLDFTILDCVCIELAFIGAYFIRYGWGNEYQLTLYRSAALILVLLHLIVVFFGEGYKGIVRRGNLEEAREVVKHATIVVVLLSVYLYLSHRGEDYSRAVYVLTWGISIVLCYINRFLWKKVIRLRAVWRSQKKSLMVVTKEETAIETIKTIKENNFGDYEISGLVLIGGKTADIGKSFNGVPVVSDENTMVQYMCHNWVDEVFFDISQGQYDCTVLVDSCEKMGIAVHQRLAKESDLFRHNQMVERMTGYTVLTSSVNIVANKEIFLKRLLDIIGGLVGVILTGAISVFVMPAIYIKSPGPVFFSQWRVGKGGKKFKIYKFRSMYLDAEERKKELMEMNNIKDGFMFKMENDPRIIKGIGQFIRDTSLDEFPQFLNVLKGDMSLVGTRPPTIDEWERYELYHRKRLAIKPGLTGMWQVCGRSKITDFDEVVELDTKYIKEWSLGLDLKILFRTVAVVLKREGAL
ncbi:MAG: sugar transferase [Ruminococcus sp.]|nr:sugar transferase [Ruminococcus sp.]